MLRCCRSFSRIFLRRNRQSGDLVQKSVGSSTAACMSFPLDAPGRTFPASTAPDPRCIAFTSISVTTGSATSLTPWRLHGDDLADPDLSCRAIDTNTIPSNTRRATGYFPTLAAFRIARPRGRPITRPREMLADAPCDTQAIRRANCRRGIRTMISCDRRKSKRSRRDRPNRFGPERYIIRGAIERCVSWSRSFRKPGPRYERLGQSFRGGVIVACTRIVGRIKG